VVKLRNVQRCLSLGPTIGPDVHTRLVEPGTLDFVSDMLAVSDMYPTSLCVKWRLTSHIS
jgi:hypothetical protein